MKTLAILVFFSVFGVALAGGATAGTFKICAQDEFGEMAYLKVHPSGVLVGHTEFDFGEGPVVAGTVFGSYKRLTYPEVMLGADINNDCKLGLFPGKLNVIMNVDDLTGDATGVLFTCSPEAPGAVIPFAGPIVPCTDTDVPTANWRKFFGEDGEWDGEDDEPDDD